MIEQMDRLFEEMRSRLAESEFGKEFVDMTRTRGVSVDLYEEDDAMVVVADMPGFDRREIFVSIQGPVLYLCAEHEDRSDPPRKNRSINEQVTIPTDIVEDEVSATYHNGVLEITLPYSEEHEEPRQIEIE